MPKIGLDLAMQQLDLGRYSAPDAHGSAWVGLSKAAPCSAQGPPGSSAPTPLKTIYQSLTAEKEPRDKRQGNNVTEKELKCIRPRKS